MRSAQEGESGTVTAEFVVVVPVVLVVLGLAIGGIFIAAHRITLVALAAEVARLEARGDEDLAAQRLSEHGDDIAVERDREGRLHCISLSSRPGAGALAGIGIEAHACAAMSGGARRVDGAGGAGDAS